MTYDCIPYGKHYIDEDDIKSVTEALTSGCLTGGKYVETFEQALAQKTGAKYAVAVSSGTAALHIAYAAAGLKTGEEVITAPVTFAATANAAVYSGGKPVFADVELSTGNMDAGSIAKLITDKTRIIAPVHYAGQPADLPEIYKIAQNNNIMVVEDACHALGALYGDAPVGSCEFSHMTAFSFHPVKHITTGEGGAVTTNDDSLCHILKLLRSHGIVTGFDKPWHKDMHFLGYNYRLTDMQAALGVSQLKKLDIFLSRRKAIAAFYDEAFRNDACITPLKVKSGRTHAYHLYPVLLPDGVDRDSFLSEVRKKNLTFQVHYGLVYDHPYYRSHGYGDTLLPAAEEFSRRVVSLPVYYSLTDEELQYTVKTVKELFQKG